MIPLKDRNPTRRAPYVTLLIIGVNIALFVYELSLGDGLPMLFQSFGIIPNDISAYLSSGEGSILSLGTLFSAMFLHGGWLHVGGNMLYLWVFGDNVEDKLGHGRFILFYLLCGIAAGALHIAIEPLSIVPTIGASGAIAGVLGAYILMFPRARVVTLIPIFIFIQIAELPALVVLGLWFVLQFFNGMLAIGNTSPDIGGVAWWAHIGGFVAGVVLVMPMRRYR